MDDDNVIPFSREPITPASLGQGVTRMGCSHRRTGWEVDPETRLVTCRACKAQVDAVDALLRIAKEWDGWTWERTFLKTDIKRKKQELESLKKEERNMKARIRTARKKLAGEVS